ASLVLSIMILPIITSLTREIFLQTPRLQEEAALALGATRWEMIRMAVLPFGKSGIVSATMLGLGGALGETMAVAMILSPGVLTASLVVSGNETIASEIAQNFPEAARHRRQNLGEGELRTVTTADTAIAKPAKLTSKQLPKATPWVVAAASIVLAAVISLIAFGGFNIPVVAILAGLINMVATFVVSVSYEGRRKAVDRVATTVVTSTFVLACVPLISLLWLTVSKGGAAISGDLLTRTMLGMKGV